jgi:TolB protein
MIKKSMRILFILISLNFTLIYSQNADELVVVLDTQNQLFPIAITEVYNEESGFPQHYLEELRKVVVFDFDVNGMTDVIPNSQKVKELVNTESFAGEMNVQAWKKLGVYYLIRLKVAQGKLSARLFSLTSGGAKVISDIPLTGDLNSDRRKIHQLSDSIYKSLFQREGIANTRILYTISSGPESNGKTWSADVWEGDYDGGNTHQVTHDGYYSVTPTYLPPKPGYASGSFFYVSYRTGIPKIYVASLRDGVGRRVSQLSGNQLHPTVTQQRDKIAFVSDTSGNPDLFLQDFNSDVGALGKPRQIFTSSGAQGSPTFSPDGRYIAFVSNMDGAPRVYVLNISEVAVKKRDIKATLITKQNRENTSPSWSPDGRYLCYSSKTDGIRQIWVYDFTTREERQLTQGNMNKENPSWAPNSLHIVYNASNPEESDLNDLYIVNLNQSKAVKISSGTGDKRFPKWEPR